MTGGSIRRWPALIAIIVCALAATAGHVPRAIAADLVLSVPLTGRYAPIGKRIEFGALAALAGTGLKTAIVDDGCDAEKVAEIAKTVRQELPRLVAGLPCFAVATALVEALQKDGVPVLATGTRSPLLDDLRRRRGLGIHELGAAAGDEARVIVDSLLPTLEGRPYALLDDGGVYGRGLAEAVRLAAENRGLAPALTANFRPLQTTQRALLRRLSRSGVEALVIAAGAEDVATIEVDLKELGLDWPIIMGARTTLMPFAEKVSAVREGLLGVEAPIPPALRAILAEQGGEANPVPADLWTAHGYIIGQIAAGLPKDAPADLAGLTVETAVGPLTFDEAGRVTPIPLRAVRWDGSAMVPLPASE